LLASHTCGLGFAFRSDLDPKEHGHPNTGPDSHDEQENGEYHNLLRRRPQMTIIALAALSLRAAG
jgi:hypothetical protein